MHQPRPYGLHVIGLPLTDKDESFISSVAMRISNLKELSGVDSMKMVYDLPDGGYVIVQDMGGNFRVIAHKPIPGTDVIYDGLASDKIPMLYSSIVTKTRVHENEGVGLKLSETTRHRLRGYDTKEPLPPRDIELQRFRIDYGNRFGEFKSNTPSALFKTQYEQLRATWYSGAMAEVMQVVGGYGRQKLADLPDNNLERATIKIPSDVAKKIKEEIGDVRLPAYSGLPPADGAYQYDYKFNHTNAVSFDVEGKPWLIRIDYSGVWAMPLPIVPATTTKAFKSYMESVKDDEILTIINRFGGMPSGETFPVAKAWEAWRRAGVIIKICDVDDFYNHIAYSSACGWSLNANGTEGYNTCYDYYDDEGLGYGLTYKLRLSLSATENHLGETAYDIKIMLPEQAERVQRYLNQLIPTLSIGTAEANAIFYKLRRVGYYVIHDRSLVRDGKDDKDYWDNLELKPIAKHTGNVSEVYRGYLYHPAKFTSQPQIKFPEPLAGGCMSHDFLPLQNGRYKDKYPNSDTIMFAYYIGNQLKVVKYFVDWGGFVQEVEDNYEKYMYVGEWYRISTNGNTKIQGFFYSSDIDERDYVSPTVTTVRTVGTDLGFDTKPKFSFDTRFSMSGTIFRLRFYKTKVNTEIISGKSIELAVCVPYLCRNAVIHGNKEYIAQNQKTEGVSRGAVQDPNVYRFWTFDPVWAWTGMTITNPKGTPYPVNGNPVWVEEYQYGPTEANSFADDGDFIGGLPADYTWLVHPINNVWNVNGGGGEPTVDNHSTTTNAEDITTGNLSISILGKSGMVNRYIPRRGYYNSSPDINGVIFRVDATTVVFGDASYGNFDEVGFDDMRAKWGVTNLANDMTTHCFIGVINE